MTWRVALSKNLSWALLWRLSGVLVAVEWWVTGLVRGG
jgi:hypothetical protein